MKKNVFAKIALIAAMGACAVTANATLATGTNTFTVTMIITSACNISTAPSNINLGTAVASTTAITNNGSNTFKVNCSNKTPFYIGLGLTSNTNNTAGSGLMSGTGSNTDKVPYQLYSDAGFTTPWGNTATATTVGNGVTGTGAGMASGKAVSFTAYAKAVNADFAPDNYTDTVTVNVNY